MINIKKAVASALCIFVLICISINTFAQESASNKFTNEFSNPSIDYEKVVFATIFLIILLFAALFFIKKVRFNNLSNQGLIEVIYSYPISTKDKLLIVKAAHEYLLLGSSSAGIRKIHVLDKEHINSLQNNTRPSTNDFANILVSLIGKKNHA